MSELVNDLAKVADDQSLLLALGAEPTPARERMAAVLAEHGVSRPCDLKGALELYDRALVRLWTVADGLVKGPLPSAVQESIDLAQEAYFLTTGQAPHSLLLCSPDELAGNPFRQSVMCG